MCATNLPIEPRSLRDSVNVYDDVSRDGSKNEADGNQSVLQQALLHSFAFRIDSRVSTTSPDFDDASAATA